MGGGAEALEEKKKLAEHLHAQGINPARWTEAHPALRIAAEGLRLNRLFRLSINETLPDGQKLDEYEGRIGTVPKGKDMSDEEWEAAAKEWVDSFLDCDEPLEADVYLDPESKHPWPGKE